MRKNLSYLAPLLGAAAAFAFAPIAVADDQGAPPPCATCVDVWTPAQPGQGTPPPNVQPGGGGGIIGLVPNGAQDVYLTGPPTSTPNGQQDQGAPPPCATCVDVWSPAQPPGQ
jgi:hypothetical protein